MNSLKRNNWKFCSTSHPKGSWSTLKSYQTNSISFHSSQISPTFSSPSLCSWNWALLSVRKDGSLGEELSWWLERETETLSLQSSTGHTQHCQIPPCRGAQGRHCSPQELRVQRELIRASASTSGTRQWHTSLRINSRFLSDSVSIWFSFYLIPFPYDSISIWFLQFSSCCLQQQLKCDRKSSSEGIQ